MRTLSIAITLMSGLLLVSPAAFGDFAEEQRQFPRVRAAWAAHARDLARQFQKAGATWPPKELYLRAFKREGALEVWARSASEEAHVLVETVPVCAASGGLGPKVRSGDQQVPEGFYWVDRFNPSSRYHLSLGIDYPNAVDLARSGDAPPGGDIFIHGSCVTIGCLPIEDKPMERLYVAAVAARNGGQARIAAHIFPCRFDDEACSALVKAQADPDIRGLWKSLAEGYFRLKTSRRPPEVRRGGSGYAVKARPNSPMKARP